MTQIQQTFKPGDEVIITVPEGTLAGEREPGGEYIDEEMLNWTEGYIDRFGATIHKNNSIRVHKPDGSDYWNFPVSWLKLKNPPEAVQETQEQEITLESIDKKIRESRDNLEHLEVLREVFLEASALGYKLTKV